MSLEGKVVIETVLEECVLPFDKAVAVGLATNELVTNAAKYAFPEGQEGGPVRVTLVADETRAEAALTVADDGRGIGAVPGKARYSEGSGQGLELLGQLSRQLGARSNSKRRSAAPASPSVSR